jgi:hypothetical protein
MGTPQKVKLEKVINMFEGVKSVEDNTKLESNIAYRLGRLSDSCRSAIRTFEKIQNKENSKRQDELNGLQKKYNTKDEQERVAFNVEAKKINDVFQEKIETMMEQEEEIKIPKFKLDDFKDKGVPVKFFSLLGEFIEAPDEK